jgi:uncharacterized protein YjiS (DUF1127 family)
MKTSVIAYLFSGYKPPGRASGVSLGGRMRQYFRTRADLRRLRALDDRMLADMGLSRSDIGMSVIREGLPD